MKIFEYIDKYLSLKILHYKIIEYITPTSNANLILFRSNIIIDIHKYYKLNNDTFIIHNKKILDSLFLNYIEILIESYLNGKK